MKPKHLKGQGQNFGFYGGVGFKPGTESWIPSVEAQETPDEPVPARFRKLRIHRTRRHRTPRAAFGEMLPILFIAGFIVLALVYLLS